MTEFWFDPRVAIAAVARRAAADAYDPEGIRGAVDRAAGLLGWSAPDRGAFGAAIAPGARVLVKPNMVLHRNEGAGGLVELVTHPTLIQAAVQSALQAGAAHVTVGDAPIQSCDFDALLAATGLDQWSRELQAREARFHGVRDFRRTIGVLKHGVRTAAENLQPKENFVLFDLASQSLLEEITKGENPFRVTWYDPRLMAKTHHPGRHQYLVARDVMEADVIVNLPKLKTHKKAGVTCALKNLIGINGNKEYLPHHRVGGAAAGGDCYPGNSRIKGALEFVADQQNMTTSRLAGEFWHALTFGLVRLSRLTGDRLGYEGSWSGNDTIWRTCLDLNRILLYGRTDGTLASTPQRRVIHLVDAVVGGQGEGPLSPIELDLGLVLAAQNAAAMDWVGAQLLGYDPNRIPLVRKPFGQFHWPLVEFAPADIHVLGDHGEGPAHEVLEYGRRAPAVIHPIGWRDAAANPSADPHAPPTASTTLSTEG